ncbi:hypothetical protein PX554_06170 [Sphingomonas sp. H39-1-10]|uniref:hypothetical protein n=1 Tax=Sphingomonas pollutisoli TaxID=3030829 RepID=UPI0023B8BA19|nr:hypothetical protein [Sphingomonas pollutisoli]MDF0487708.1 hypothetical protein [Sphingomonas pollutisoli]
MRRRRRAQVSALADESQPKIERIPGETADLAQPQTSPTPTVAPLPQGRSAEDRTSVEKNSSGATSAHAEQTSTPDDNLSPKTSPPCPAGSAAATGIYDEDEPHIARRDRFSDQLVAKAQGVFRDRLKRDVSEAEARLLLGNLTDFYELALVRRRRLIRASQDGSGRGADP